MFNQFNLKYIYIHICLCNKILFLYKREASVFICEFLGLRKENI